MKGTALAPSPFGGRCGATIGPASCCWYIVMILVFPSIIAGRDSGLNLVRHLAVVAVALVPFAAQVSGASSGGASDCHFATATGSSIEVQKVRLGGATRDAFEANLSSDSILSCPSGEGVLIASAGTLGLVAGESFAFQIGVEQDGVWDWVLDETVSGPESRWADFRVELPALPTGGRRLRFHAINSSPKSSAKAFWGAVRVLPGGGEGERPPNIVMISLDTLGAGYLGSFGGHVEASRNIERYLERAFSFRRAYAPYPNTLVSHASLFSGLYPSTHGVYGGIRDSQVSVDLLSTVLRREGYLNVAFTENAFVSSDFGFDRDFDWYDNGPQREGGSFLGDAKQTFANARAWLERYGEDAPFLLFVHTYEVHSPYIIRDARSRAIADEVFAGAEVESDASSSADMERLHNAGFSRLSPDQVRRLEALHVGEIGYLDRHFAQLVSALDAMPSANRTLVVVFADHGDEFDPEGKIGHGETLADEVLHVPLAFYLPGRFGPGRYDAPVSLVDVAPTVLEFLGKEGAFPVDGRSLLSLLDGRSEELEPRPVFAELQKAAGTCQELRLPEDCFVGRFVTYSGDDRFESSMVPHYERLTIGGEVVAPDPAELGALHALLSGYVTGAPWLTKVPWRPQSVRVDRSKRPAIDDVTRQRLEALGYDF